MENLTTHYRRRNIKVSQTVSDLVTGAPDSRMSSTMPTDQSTPSDESGVKKKRESPETFEEDLLATPGEDTNGIYERSKTESPGVSDKVPATDRKEIQKKKEDDALAELPTGRKIYDRATDGQQRFTNIHGRLSGVAKVTDGLPSLMFRRLSGLAAVSRSSRGSRTGLRN